jgi:hypothetical protein
MGVQRDWARWHAAHNVPAGSHGDLGHYRKDLSAAVSALAKLGVSDHLETGPKAAEVLAAFVNAKPDLLARLMRATESMGILAQAADGKSA